MEQTVAKALVREHFYREFLTAHSTPDLLQDSYFLVLLGDSGEEEKLLLELGIHPSHVYCVENDMDVFAVLSARARNREFECGLYFGELSDFIKHYLRETKRFGVLNLDIYGSYLNHIDPVMTDVLLFARRNPRTVVATYSYGGRDRAQLREGLRSLVLLTWIAPEATKQAVNELFGRYRSAGVKPEASFNMVLRQMFWLRSNMERALCGAVLTGTARSVSAQLFLDETATAWKQFLVGSPGKLSYRSLLARIQKLAKPRSKARLLDLAIKQLSITAYQTANNTYHLGWFATYERVDNVTPTDWLPGALSSLTEKPLMFANGNSFALLQVTEAQEIVSPGFVIWDEKDLHYARRVVSLPMRAPQLSMLERSSHNKS
jgi:hypothetical protein